MQDINRRIVTRMLAAWVGVSLIMGGGVLIYGLEKIDDHLVDIATLEARKFVDAAQPLLDDPGSNSDVAQRHADRLVSENFVIVELYDRQHRLLIQRINPQHAAVEEHLSRNEHDFPTDDSLQYRKMMVGNDAVLQVLVPMKDERGGVAGFFEGVSLIDPQMLNSLRQEAAITLIVVLLSVLFTTVVLYPVVLALNRDVIRYSRDLLRGNIELMEVLGSAIAQRDSETNLHNYRVTLYATRLADAAGVNAGDIRELIAGAFLHDVGKIGISDNILLKPARLTEEQFAIMKQHVSRGVDILRKSAWLQRARDVVEFHHEKFDGSGYLKGLSGEAIPLTARIFAIVDVFDALTSWRPYKAALPFDESMAILQRDSGGHFDPRLLAIFAGIAEPLFRDIRQAPDDEVEQQLRATIERYFLKGAS